MSTINHTKVSIPADRSLKKQLAQLELNEDDSLLAATSLSDLFSDAPPAGEFY
jgi:hypothetical protein